MSVARRFLVVFTVVAGLASVFPAARLFAAEPAHLASARQLLQALWPEQTNYQHNQGTVIWPGDAGSSPECRTDCSGFIDALLKHTYGLKSADLRKWFGKGRPLAKDYYAAIAEEKGFRRVPVISQLRPGDILAVQYPVGSSNTGHVMLVAGTPKARAASAPLVAGTWQWEVNIIDESESGHGATDTRHKPDKTMRDGLGRGVLRIYTDAEGRIAGYAWSTLKVSKFESVRTHPFVIGRLAEEFLKTAK
jgi:hypothetical protein